MPERNPLDEGLTHAAWGYLFLNLDINLGSVSILPRFVGWLLFLSAIQELKEDRRDLALLRPLGILLAVWSGLDWGASWLGGDIDGLLPPLDLLTAVAQMYFHFQFLTDLAALAQQYCPLADLSRRILRRRAAQTLLVTGFALIPYLPARWSGTPVLNGTMLVLAAAYCLLGLSLMLCLFTLRDRLRNRPPESGPDWA